MLSRRVHIVVSSAGLLGLKCVPCTDGAVAWRWTNSPILGAAAKAVDGILIQRHGIKCDGSSAAGESDLLKKTAADEGFRAMILEVLVLRPIRDFGGYVGNLML